MGKTRKDRLDDDRFNNREVGGRDRGTQKRRRSSNDLKQFRNASSDEIIDNYDDIDDVQELG